MGFIDTFMVSLLKLWAGNLYMQNEFQKQHLNRFLKKFDLQVKEERQCSGVVAEWTVRMQDRRAFSSMHRKTKNYVDKMIQGVDQALAKYALQPDVANQDAVNGFENQKRLLVLAQKNLKEGDDSVREVYEMLLAGIQSAHASLKQDPLKKMPTMVQPILDVWTEGTTPQETALLPRLKFLQKSRSFPDGRVEYFIIMHPNALVSWAARKEMNKSEAADLVEKKTTDLMKYFMHAGGEEYYHVFQASNPEKAKEMKKKSETHYGTKNYVQARLQKQRELLGVEWTDSKEFQRLNEAYHMSDPVEADAHNFMNRQDKMHDAMAKAYYKNIQRSIA